MQHYKGQRFLIPRIASHLESHPLTEVLGLETAKKLAAEAGGSHITIPLCLGPLRAARDLEIWRRYMDGVPTSQLVREYGMTWRSIQKVTQRVRMREGAPAREAKSAKQLGFSWIQNLVAKPEKPE